jgi:CRISPR-associated protein Csm2
MNPYHHQNRDNHSPPPLSIDDIRFSDAGVTPELYAGVAEAKAKAIAASGGNDQNKNTQLRRFYNELIQWNEKVNTTGTISERADRYKKFAPLVKMLHAKVVYAQGRNRVDKNFVIMFRQVINEIKDPDTLHQAKLFMEAFMGFYKVTDKGAN